MIKKLFVIFILILNIFLVYSGSDCFFDTNSCERTSLSFDTFNLVFEDQSLLDSFDAKIYNKDNPSNEIRLNINQIDKTIRNLNPFIDSGVYVLEVRAKSKSGSIKTSNYEFIFDNLEPMPPIIPLNLIGNIVNGKTDFPNTLISVEDENGEILFSGNSDLNGNFQADLGTLVNEINYIKFFTQNSNGIKSFPIERIIFKNEIIENPQVTIDSIIIDDFNLINDRTINRFTSKRNFYVSGKVTGTNLEGSIVYVNGIKTLTDSNGNFGQFILLNEELNTINVQDKEGRISVSSQITYINPRFKFTQFEVNKIVSSNSLQIKGETNYDLPFNVYLNGEYSKTFTPTNGIFDFTEIGLIPGKNYLYLEGLNNERIFEIIYYDNESPIINLISPDKISNSNDFIFEIIDDISIDINSVNINFNNNQYLYSGNNINKLGDFYKIDISELVDGNYSYTINVNDLSGKNSILSGNLNIANTNTLIENIYSENGYFVGNKLFLDSRSITLFLNPSRNLAFKSIFLNNLRQTNYEFITKDEIKIDLENLESSGIIKLNFINNNYEEFSQIFYYFTDLEKPKVVLDYIENSQSFDNRAVKISGEILDSHFDWTTLEFNSQKNNYNRYGKYFESNVILQNGQNNLEIFGMDYSNNIIFNGVYGGIIYGDNSFESINSQISFNTTSFNSALVGSDINTKKYLNSYDGLDFFKVYLKENNFNLPVAQRNGIRSINLKGVESSGKKFSNYEAFSIDSIKPKVYYVLDYNTEQKKLILDGTLSEIEINSINILIDGIDLVSKSFCQDSLSVFSSCIILPNVFSNLEISFNDISGNSIIKSFTSSDYVDLSSLTILSNKEPQIYFSGNDKITNEKNYFIQGQIRSFNKILSVKISNKNCLFDDFNFICNVVLNSGNNNFIVDVIDSNNQINSNNFEIILDQGNFTVDILNISGDKIYNDGNAYFIFSPNFLIEGITNKNSLIKFLINDNEFSVGGKSYGNFYIPLNLSNEINDKEYTTINLQIKAEDELGNQAFSDNLILIYDRIIRTIVNVLIN